MTVQRGGGGREPWLKSKRAVFKTLPSNAAPTWKRRALTITAPPTVQSEERSGDLGDEELGPRVTSALTQRTHRLDPRSLACTRSHVGTRDKKRNGGLGDLSSPLPLPSSVLLAPPKEGGDAARKRWKAPGRRGAPLASHSRLGRYALSRNICLVDCN